MSNPDRTPARIRARWETREAQLAKLGYDSYPAYLNSARWANVRSRYIRSGASMTCMCGATDGVQLHHKTYERVGNEEIGDLEPLCNKCHQLVHALERKGGIGLDLSGLTLDQQRAAEARVREAARVKRIRTEQQDESEALANSQEARARRAALLCLAAYHRELARIYGVTAGVVKEKTAGYSFAAVNNLGRQARAVQQMRRSEQPEPEVEAA